VIAVAPVTSRIIHFNPPFRVVLLSPVTVSHAKGTTETVNALLRVLTIFTVFQRFPTACGRVITVFEIGATVTILAQAVIVQVEVIFCIVSILAPPLPLPPQNVNILLYIIN
jgi:hypothetical protein